MSRYSRMFSRLRAAGEGAFVPFVMLGDPTPELSEEVVEALIDGGADALELGAPFSDPVADGPTIQRAHIRALEAGTGFSRSMEVVARVRARHPEIPIGMLIYGNVPFSVGPRDFYAACARAGVDSVLLPDVGRPIALHEFIYPVLQAYDSVVIKADVEMGGNDQIFNLLAGRDLMRARGMEPQVALTMPLLVGTDGTKKMSKSYGNYVGLTDSASDMFGKLMSITDELVPMYFRLCSTLSLNEVDAIDLAYADGTADPYELKRTLAANIVDLYHGAGEGARAMAAFDATFRKSEVPADIAEFPLSVVEVNDQGQVYLGKLLVSVKIVASAGEARRLIDGGGVKIDGETVASKRYNVEPSLLSSGTVLQVGKRRWARLV